MEEMSGETKTSPRLQLNEIQFNGQKGSYVYIDKIKGLVEQGDGKKKYEKIDLGEDISVVFLRIRRKLRQFRKGENPLTTNEHNSKHDMLTLFGGTSIVKGTNDDLREKFTGLKTNQIVYCLLLGKGDEPELVRLVVKGASLGSEVKGKDVHDFYSYISSFKDKGREDHFYQFITELSSISEEGQLGSYYAMGYKEGDKVTPELNEQAILPAMQKVFDFVNQSDLYYKTKNVQEIQKEKDVERDEDIDTIEYPEEEINADDIPF